MQVFHIRYRNTQGTLMRILNAASRRGLDLPYVQAEALDHTHNVTLLLDVNPKQIGDSPRDLLLNGEDILHFTLKGFRPEVMAAYRLNGLGGNPQLLA